MLPIIQRYILEAIKGFDTIPEERKRALHQIISYVQKKSDANHVPELLYICMRNSRMSQLGQIWGSVAATYYGFPYVKTYSGGIHASAFDIGSIRIIERIGFSVKQTDSTPNPTYTIQFGDSDIPITCFSKKYGDSENPTQGFCVIMMCGEAAKVLSSIDGAELWVSTVYADFKTAAPTADSDELYLESSKEIATECLYVFAQLLQV